MKKKKARKLTLKRETLRALDKTELMKVAGGAQGNNGDKPMAKFSDWPWDCWYCFDP